MKSALARRARPRAALGRTRVREAGGIGTEAVNARTGKSWDEWFAILDRSGARRQTHKQIVSVLATRYGLPPWWRQMVAVGYEQARGLRAKHETAAGFQISRSRTIASPVRRVYRAWSDGEQRSGWLSAADVVIRTATRNRSLRITWPNKTSVEVMLYPKGASRTQVTVQHRKLPSAAAGERMKRFWGEALERLAGATRAS